MAHDIKKRIWKRKKYVFDYKTGLIFSNYLQMSKPIIDNNG